MKKLGKALLAFALAGSALLPLFAKSAREEMKPSKNWNLYLPGKKNKNDVQKDLEKAISLY